MPEAGQDGGRGPRLPGQDGGRGLRLPGDGSARGRLHRTGEGPGDDEGGGEVLGEELSHLEHVGGGVGEEFAVAGAEGVQAGLAGFRAVETVLGAFAVAEVQVLAGAAFARQAIALGDAEPDHRVGLHHFRDAVLADVAQQVLGVNKVITGIEVAVVLEDGVLAAGLAIDAEPRGDAAPAGERGVEEVDVVLADIAPDPFVEDVTHEFAEGDITDTPAGQGRAGRVRIHDPGARLAVLLAPDNRVADVLHHRHELHVVAADSL